MKKHKNTAWWLVPGNSDMLKSKVVNILFIQNTNPDQGSMFIIKKSHKEKIEKAFKNAKVSIARQGSKQVEEYLKETEIIIVPAVENIDLKKAPKLFWIHVTSAGVNKVSKELMESQILITNSSGVHPIQISEQVLGYMLMFSRSLNKAFKNQILKKTWIRNYDYYQASELFSKTVGVIGMGRIGERIALLAKALGMNIISVIRTKKKKSKIVDLQITYDQMDRVLGKCDYIVNCLPLTKDTTQLFNQEKFKKFKMGSVYINIGRGQTTNEKDLITFLKNGHIKGTALDVFEEEPLPDSSKLWDLDNVVITPHMAGWSPNYLDRVVDIFIENLKAYLNKKPLPNLIDKKLGY